MNHINYLFSSPHCLPARLGRWRREVGVPPGEGGGVRHLFSSLQLRAPYPKPLGKLRSGRLALITAISS